VRDRIAHAARLRPMLRCVATAVRRCPRRGKASRMWPACTWRSSHRSRRPRLVSWLDNSEVLAPLAAEEPTSLVIRSNTAAGAVLFAVQVGLRRPAGVQRVRGNRRAGAPAGEFVGEQSLFISLVRL